MKISEVIEKLSAIQATNGDIPVRRYDYDEGEDYEITEIYVEKPASQTRAKREKDPELASERVIVG